MHHVCVCVCVNNFHADDALLRLQFLHDISDVLAEMHAIQKAEPCEAVYRVDVHTQYTVFFLILSIRSRWEECC